MQLLIYKNNFSDTFLHEDLPKFYTNKICYELSQPGCIPMINYIKDNYGISLKELCNIIVKHFEVQDYQYYIILTFDKNIPINNKIYLDQLLRLIDSGDLQIKGTGILTKIKNYILHNLRTIQRYLYLKKVEKGIE